MSVLIPAAFALLRIILSQAIPPRFYQGFVKELPHLRGDLRRVERLRSRAEDEPLGRCRSSGTLDRPIISKR